MMPLKHNQGWYVKSQREGQYLILYDDAKIAQDRAASVRPYR